MRVARARRGAPRGQRPRRASSPACARRRSRGASRTDLHLAHDLALALLPAIRAESALDELHLAHLLKAADRTQSLVEARGEARLVREIGDPERQPLRVER